MKNLHEKALDAFLQTLILSQGSYKIKNIQLWLTQINETKRKMKEISALEVLTENLHIIGRKKLLLNIVSTDEYKSEIKKFATYFCDLKSMSNSLNVCIIYAREKYQANPTIIENYLFSNPFFLYIHKINKRNFDHLYYSEHSESNPFTSEKWTYLQILIQNMFNIRFIENFSLDILIELFGIIYPHKMFYDISQKIANLIEKKGNYSAFDCDNIDLILNFRI